MSYVQIIDNNLLQTFRLLKDLAVDATFNVRTNVDFDFNSAEVTEDPSVPSTTKVVVVEGEKINTKSKTVRQQILFKSKEIGDLKAYDTVVISGVTWTLGSPIHDGGYIVFIEIYREL